MKVPDSTAPRRRWLLAAGALVVLAGVVALVIGLGGSGNADGGPPAAAPATSSAATSSSAAPTSIALAPVAVTPEPTGPTSDAGEAPPALDPVALDEPAAVGNGITAQVVSVRSVQT